MTLLFVLIPLLIVVVLLFPKKETKSNFNEKDESIRIFREEVAFINSQFKKRLIDNHTKKQLLQENNEKSARALLNITETTFSSRSSKSMDICIIICIFISSYIFYYSYQKNNIDDWQVILNRHSEISNTPLNKEILRQTLTQFSSREAEQFCFALQSHYLRDNERLQSPDNLTTIAQCHLLLGYSDIAEKVVSQTLRLFPNHVPSLYLLGELEFLQNQRLSPTTEFKLIQVVKNASPFDVDAAYLLMLNSYGQGKVTETRKFIAILRPFTKNKPNMDDMLDMIEQELTD